MSSRVQVALQQGAVVVVALLVGGVLTAQLRPIEATERAMVSTPWFWAAVLWAIVLLVNAFAFSASQLPVIERVPLYVAVGIALVVFIVGLVSFDAGPAGRRIIYVAANAVGALVFWWAVLALITLFTRKPQGV